MAGIPENAETIYNFLRAHGYSANAAAGILGNIEQESGGNPSAGSNPPGSGLIQQLGYPTGTTLAAAMNDILTYNNAQGASLIAKLNAATSPVQAATIYSEDFERPGIPDLSNRTASASLVAAAAASGNWASTTTGQTGGSGSTSGGTQATETSVWSTLAGLPGLDFISGLTGAASTIGDVGSGINDLAKEIGHAIALFNLLFQPKTWLRVGAFLIGILTGGAGLYFLTKAMSINPGISAVTGGGMPIPIPV